jgi:hypothetical protein
MVFSIATLWIGSGLVRCAGTITLGCGDVVVGCASFSGGFVVASLNVTRRCTGVGRSSNADSGSGVLVRMVSSRFSASSCFQFFVVAFSLQSLC